MQNTHIFCKEIRKTLNNTEPTLIQMKEVAGQVDVKKRQILQGWFAVGFRVYARYVCRRIYSGRTCAAHRRLCEICAINSLVYFIK